MEQVTGENIAPLVIMRTLIVHQSNLLCRRSFGSWQIPPQQTSAEKNTTFLSFGW